MRRRGVVAAPGEPIGDTGTCWVYDEKLQRYYLFFDDCHSTDPNQFVQIGNHDNYFAMGKRGTLTREDCLHEGPLPEGAKLLNSKGTYIYNSSEKGPMKPILAAQSQQYGG